MKPYAELLEFNQPNPIRKPGFTRIRDQFPALRHSNGSFHDPERIMEFAGRWDYGPNSAAKLGQPSKQKTVLLRDPATGEGREYGETSMIAKWMASGEESMIEMGDATFFIECSSAVGRQITRHRLVSYQQESQRYTKYDEEEPGDLFFLPNLPDVPPADDSVVEHYERSLALYKELRRVGVAPQDARYVFPMSMRTRLVMKANARERRHILKLRTHKSAQPEMRELMLQVHDQLVDIFPNAMAGILDGERAVR